MSGYGEAGTAGHHVVRAPYGVVEDAVESIGTTLDEHTTCAEVVRFLCRHGCDAAAVDLLAEEAPADADAPAAALTRAAAEGRADLLETGMSRSGGALEVHALDEGHPITAGTQLVGGVPRSVMTVPLLAHGRLYGALLAVRSGAPFSAYDTATLHYVARLAAVHLGHDRRHTAVHDTALNLQRALLAEPGRPHPNLDIATRYLPVGGGTLVGGDWYETVRLHFGRTLLVMGDVMGHGLDAAVDMNAYRSTLRYVASTDLPPHRVLRQLDAAVAEDSTRRPATCLLARVDPARGNAAIATAGHLPPVLFSADGAGRLLDLPVGPPLGTGVGGYALTEQRLVPGDTLVLFTDGLVERRDEDIDVSLARLAALRVPPGAAPQDLLDLILTHVAASRAEDDVAILAARLRRGGST
ncbi:PP2C family protein-serine/threonine phosphatase [Actinacidiphila bryophytorum]|uniref:PP2C family protein-serine/threonine phosphatase n=1 Tax=Actinacidiphila bryophytorum TaxID=1436133 RepID=UPI0021769B81|nr:GAF domain-containing SpoIIE family protein phosphatase [Actinacidiphila bryophytorum]UWE07413.1 SpoIIE family protein phosphatase [Actinacidiphila bryophytorum]